MHVPSALMPFSPRETPTATGCIERILRHCNDASPQPWIRTVFNIKPADCRLHPNTPTVDCYLANPQGVQLLSFLPLFSQKPRGDTEPCTNNDLSRPIG